MQGYWGYPILYAVIYIMECNLELNSELITSLPIPVTLGIYDGSKEEEEAYQTRDQNAIKVFVIISPFGTIDCSGVYGIIHAFSSSCSDIIGSSSSDVN